MWQPIATAPENVLVLTKIHDSNGKRNEAQLCRRGKLWFHPTGDMYVYYQPTHWRRVGIGSFFDDPPTPLLDHIRGHIDVINDKEALEDIAVHIDKRLKSIT